MDIFWKSKQFSVLSSWALKVFKFFFAFCFNKIIIYKDPFSNPLQRLYVTFWLEKTWRNCLGPSKYHRKAANDMSFWRIYFHPKTGCHRVVIASVSKNMLLEHHNNKQLKKKISENWKAQFWFYKSSKNIHLGPNS